MLKKALCVAPVSVVPTTTRTAKGFVRVCCLFCCFSLNFSSLKFLGIPSPLLSDFVGLSMERSVTFDITNGKRGSGESPSMSLVASSVVSSFSAWLIKIATSCSLSRALVRSYGAPKGKKIRIYYLQYEHKFFMARQKGKKYESIIYNTNINF